MANEDGEEIRATMKSLELLWKQIAQGKREATPSGIGGFLFQLNSLLQFASEDTAQKLQQIIEAMEKAKEQLEETKDDFDPMAITILQMMHELVESPVRIIIFHDFGV